MTACSKEKRMLFKTSPKLSYKLQYFKIIKHKNWIAFYYTPCIENLLNMFLERNRTRMSFMYGINHGVENASQI